MKVCGIEIKANEAILAVAERQDASFQYRPLPLKKLALADDDLAANVRAFRAQLEALVEAHQLSHIAIKKRSKKGEFAGGPVTFKIEAIIQLLEGCEVTLLSPQTISAMQKKRQIELPADLNKYQHDAFLTACTALTKLVC